MKKRGASLLWKRLLAFLIDQGIIFAIIIFPFNDFFKNLESNSYLENIDASIFIAYLIISILTLLYWVVFETLFRQTAGKAILGIFVKSTEKEITLWQIIARNLPKVSWLLIFFDSIPILFRKEQQRYFERISKTEVTDGK